MEFQQKHRNKAERIAAKQAGESNKPDMQAIRFGSDGKPEALVFVEVKCTRNAYNGESGLYKHIDAMLKYPDTALKRRRREAYLILHQYKELGLRSFERELNWQEYENLPLEILLVLTDNAKTLWEEDESLKVKEIKEDNRNKNQGEISLSDGENAVLIVV